MRTSGARMQLHGCRIVQPNSCVWRWCWHGERDTRDRASGRAGRDLALADRSRASSRAGSRPRSSSSPGRAGPSRRRASPIRAPASSSASTRTSCCASAGGRSRTRTRPRRSSSSWTTIPTGTRVRVTETEGVPASASGRARGRSRSRMIDPGVVFGALADDTRRTVFVRVAASGQATASELARDLPVTRQAVAKHLSLLASAGLVGERARGPRDALPRPRRAAAATRSTGWRASARAGTSGWRAWRRSPTG